MLLTLVYKSTFLVTEIFTGCKNKVKFTLKVYSQIIVSKAYIKVRSVDK